MNWRALADAAAKVWNYGLISVGGGFIKVGQIVVALIVLIVGIWLSRRATRAVSKKLSKNSRVDPGVAVAVEKITLYFLTALVVIFAFQLLRIPITIFAFLGGTLAIGLGFGAQNIFANFISGLILMLERPIRIGDLVEVGPHRGRVEEVRFRCTRVRCNDGIDILVPNSSFLDNTVINWTLSDKKIRATITAGVVYGSPTDEVVRLMRKSVEEHPRVLSEPEPVIEFQEFGDNSLVFVAYFWTELRTMMDRRIVCSDIRLAMDRLFREADIVIAFPQRDVHLDAKEPINVRVSMPERAEG